MVERGHDFVVHHIIQSNKKGTLVSHSRIDTSCGISRSVSRSVDDNRLTHITTIHRIVRVAAHAESSTGTRRTSRWTVDAYILTAVVVLSIGTCYRQIADVDHRRGAQSAIDSQGVLPEM